jgi:hypothetical protein
MKIMVLEDRGVVSAPLIAALREAGHTVSDAGWIYDAIGIWKREESDCLIVDLNMVPDGLTDEQIEETQGGLLTGWVWLKHYVFETGEHWKRRTLIYTRYFQEFADLVPESERAGVKVISKTGKHAAAEVLAFVSTVARGGAS